jgi:hypothetical protein
VESWLLKAVRTAAEAVRRSNEEFRAEIPGRRDIVVSHYQIHGDFAQECRYLVQGPEELLYGKPFGEVVDMYFNGGWLDLPQPVYHSAW